MKLYAIGLVGLLIASTSLRGAAEPRYSEPVSPPAIHAILTDLCQTTGVPALAAASITSAAITYDAVGLRRADGTDVVQPGDFFQLGSCTKSMTATLAAMLVQEGKLSWDETIEQAFPVASRANHSATFRVAALYQLRLANLPGKSV